MIGGKVELGEKDLAWENLREPTEEERYIINNRLLQALRDDCLEKIDGLAFLGLEITVLVLIGFCLYYSEYATISVLGVGLIGLVAYHISKCSNIRLNNLIEEDIKSRNYEVCRVNVNNSSINKHDIIFYETHANEVALAVYLYGAKKFVISSL